MRFENEIQYPPETGHAFKVTTKMGSAQTRKAEK
jgi:hypothetical protein